MRNALYAVVKPIDHVIGGITVYDKKKKNVFVL